MVTSFHTYHEYRIPFKLPISGRCAQCGRKLTMKHNAHVGAVLICCVRLILTVHRRTPMSDETHDASDGTIQRHDFDYLWCAAQE